MGLKRNTAVISLSALVAVISGVVLDGITVAVFGLGTETDAYFVSSLIPLAAITILHLQSGKVVQPLFIHTWNSEGPPQAWRFLRITISVASVILLLLGLACLPLAPMIVKMQAPGSSDSTRILAAQLCQFFFLMPALYAPVVLMKDAVIALGNFTVPGSLKPIENVLKIAFVLLFVGKLGILALPIGMAIGIIVQLAVIYVPLKRRGFIFWPAFHIREPRVANAIGLLGFPMIGHFSYLATEVVQNIFASMTSAGGVSALRLATRIVDSFAGLLANSIVVAVMPLVTHSLANADPERMKENIREGIRLLLLLSVPASAWILIMNKPLISVLFERMRFSSGDTDLVSSLLILMVPYILLSRLFGLAETGFYGGCDTRTPLTGALALTGAYVALMAILFVPLKIHALPIARSLSYFIGAGVMLYLLRRKFGKLGLASLTNDSVKLAAATVVMVLCIFAGRWLCQYVNGSGIFLKIVNLLIPSSMGFLGLAISCAWLKIVDPKAIRTAVIPGKVAI